MRNSSRNLLLYDSPVNICVIKPLHEVRAVGGRYRDHFIFRRKRSLLSKQSIFHDDPTSNSASRADEILPNPEPATLEEQSPQLNNDMTLADNYLPAGRSASTVEENPQHVSSAPETVPTDKRADPAVSTDEFVSVASSVYAVNTAVFSPNNTYGSTTSNQKYVLYHTAVQ
jgi:hypothetical protein